MNTANKKPSISDKHRAAPARAERAPRLNKDQQLLADQNDDQLTRAFEAIARYNRRQERTEHPDGYFDNAKRFYPSDKENNGVTSNTRSPSRAFPFSYLTACRSLDHCERLEKANHQVVLSARRVLKAEDRATDSMKAADFTGMVRGWSGPRVDMDVAMPAKKPTARVRV